jgi:hypothetical protein
VEQSDRVGVRDYAGPTDAIDPGSDVALPNATSVQAIPASGKRLKFWIHNRSTVPVGVRFASGGAAVGAVAFYLEPGDIWEEQDWKGAVSLIQASGSPQVVYRGII